MKVSSSKKQGVITNKKPAPSAFSIDGHPFPARLQIFKNSLTEKEKKAGDYFLKNPQAAYLSITEVVEDSSLGYGTIIRFCRKLGCDGFQEFKVLLAQELGSQDLDSEKSKSDSISKYTEKIKSELSNTEKLLDRTLLVNIAEVLNEAKHVLVAGIAGSASLAIGFDYRLSRIGICSTAVCEGYVLAIRAASMEPGDVFFAISFSGATKDILTAAETAKARGVVVVSLTNFIHAPLVELADHSLFSATDRDPLSCEIFSKITGDFVLDILFSQLYDIREDAGKMVERTFKAISDRRI